MTLPLTPYLQSLLLILSHISQALIQAHLQVQYLELDVPKHVVEHSYFCHIISCPYHYDY